MSKQTNYYIGIGAKNQFYTLWEEQIIDIRPRDENGNILPYTPRANASGQDMNHFVLHNYIQNLSKTKDGAIQKIKDLNIPLSEDEIDFIKCNNTKPYLKAYGGKLTFRTKGGRSYYYGETTQSFWTEWRKDKETMRSFGWSCFKGGSTWYMVNSNKDIQTKK